MTIQQPTHEPTQTPDLGAIRPTLVDYTIDGEQAQALVCRPDGEEPFPIVVYNHAMVVDIRGYQGAVERGYNLEGVCMALAEEGFLAFVPIRQSGRGNLPGHKREVSLAIDYVKGRTDVDSSRTTLMGLSRGGLLTLMVGLERTDLEALVILAPAPGIGHFAEAVKRVTSINVPVLLLVEHEDSPEILADYDMLKNALNEHGKDVRAIRYTQGGGHQLFFDVSYWWTDISAFLGDHS